MANASDEGWAALLKSWALRTYTQEQLDALSKGTPAQLNEAIGDHSASTREKAIRFFVSAAEEAGITIAPHHKKTRSAGSSATTARKPRKRRSQNTAQGDAAKPTENTPSDLDVIPIMIGNKTGGKIMLPKSIAAEDIKYLEAAFEYAKMFIQSKGGAP